MPSSDTRTRLQALRRLLQNEEASTQEELREALENMDFAVTQSTVSRDLRRLGAVKITDAQGQATYRLPPDPPSGPFIEGLGDLILNVAHNGAMIVLNTTPGSASLVARHIDHLRLDEILGTIAGDDTVFIAPASLKKIGALAKEIESSIYSED
jgi:transcriptional regulator of arginine metabolism